MYLWSTDVPSDDGTSDVSAPEASQRFGSHWAPPELHPGKYWSHPPQAAGQDQAGSQALGFPSAQGAGQGGRRGQSTVQSIHPICAQSCWGSALEAWTEHKIPARNGLRAYEHNSWQKFITSSSRAVLYTFEDMLLCSIHFLLFSISVDG